MPVGLFCVNVAVTALVDTLIISITYVAVAPNKLTNDIVAPVDVIADAVTLVGHGNTPAITLACVSLHVSILFVAQKAIDTFKSCCVFNVGTLINNPPASFCKEATLTKEVTATLLISVIVIIVEPLQSLNAAGIEDV